MAYALTYELINNDTEYSITGCTGDPAEVVIPKEYNALPVTLIGPTAFVGCKNLTKVVIPDSITMISEVAFFECSGLTSVVIPDSVTSIGNAAFLGCYNLANVVIGNGVTSIGSAVFRYCTSLTSITIPDSVTTIGDWAFADCSNLTKVTLLAKTPASLLGAYSFSSDITLYCFSEAIEAYKTTTNWNAFANNFIADDMRLYFTMNARAQKNYFASKEQVETLLVDMKSYIQQYIRDNFATLMAEYLNSEAAVENKPTSTDISEVFDENEEA